MANEYGLDHKYFKGKLELIIRDASRYTPDEMARSLARLSQTADKAVLLESEFQNHQCSDKEIAAKIHYPDCWDSAAYPTLFSALNEMGCNPDNCTKTQ